MSSDPPPIKVEIPQNIQVRSPETDQHIDAVRTAFESFGRQLDQTTGRIVTSLERLTQLPQMIAHLQQTVASQFHQLFAHEVEIAAGGRLAAMQAADSKRAAARDALSERQARLGEEREGLESRYGELLAQIAADCEFRVRQLDSHAFEIVEQAYPKQVQRRFELDSTPAVKLLAEHADESAVARTLCLGEKLSALDGAIAVARMELAGFQAEVARLATPDGPPVGWYRLPCLFVELEDSVSGERRLEVLLDEAPGLDALGPDIGARMRERLDRSLATASTTALGPQETALLAEAMAAAGATDEDVQDFRAVATERPIAWRGGRP